MAPKFVKVMPKDYKRDARKPSSAADEVGLSGEEAIMAAFEENAQRRRPRWRRIMQQPVNAIQ